ncbi:hypothetical protein [Burkholderia metallica]
MTSADDLLLYQPLNRLSKPRLFAVRAAGRGILLAHRTPPGVATRRTFRRPFRAAAVW